jgi:hypothetical protein
MFSSIFTAFGGYLINYTALFFFLIAAGVYNFKKSMSDERINLCVDFTVYFIWAAALLLILFPASSIQAGIVNFPFAEIILMLVTAFFVSFFYKSKAAVFFKSYAFLMLLLFILPYNLLNYINYPFNLLIYIWFGKKVLILVSALAALALLISIGYGFYKKSVIGAIKVFIYQILTLLSFFIYFVLVPRLLHHKLQRIGYILFYTALFPCFYLFYKKQDSIYLSIKDYFSTKGINNDKQKTKA